MGAAGQRVRDPQRYAARGRQRLHVPCGFMGLAGIPLIDFLSRLLVFLSAHRSEEISVPSRIR